jgi:hypothetical protein
MEGTTLDCQILHVERSTIREGSKFREIWIHQKHAEFDRLLSLKISCCQDHRKATLSNFCMSCAVPSKGRLKKVPGEKAIAFYLKTLFAL